MTTKPKPPTSKPSTPKYAEPRVAFMDLDEDVAEALRREGFNVSVVSYGVPYKVPKRDGFAPVIPNGRIPEHFLEKQIVVVDLSVSEISDAAPGEKVVSHGSLDFWASCSK